eukprot:3454452-Prymnesium_polylepis.1
MAAAAAWEHSGGGGMAAWRRCTRQDGRRDVVVRLALDGERHLEPRPLRARGGARLQRRHHGCGSSRHQWVWSITSSWRRAGAVRLWEASSAAAIMMVNHVIMIARGGARLQPRGSGSGLAVTACGRGCASGGEGCAVGFGSLVRGLGCHRVCVAGLRVDNVRHDEAIGLGEARALGHDRPRRVDERPRRPDRRGATRRCDARARAHALIARTRTCALIARTRAHTHCRRSCTAPLAPSHTALAHTHRRSHRPERW